MPADPKHNPSFSPARRWGIGLDILLRTLLVMAIVVMANFISAKFSHRFYLSSQTRIKLSAHTINVLQSITNHVTVTLYYDQGDEMYSTIKALLTEYQRANPNISVQTVDYVRNMADAEKIKDQYNLGAEENLVIFASNRGFKIAPGDALVQSKLEPALHQDPNEKEPEFRKKPVAFNGEMIFTSLLLAITNPKPFKAYYLQGEKEEAFTDTSDTGYYKFATVVAQNDINLEPLTLTGGADIPDDCDLLIIAGPQVAFSEQELEKIDLYLSQGGRLFALFNYYSIKNPTGLEPILQRWGVNIGFDWVRDMDNSPSHGGQDLEVSSFAKHPMVNSLVGSSLYLILPRPVSRVNFQNPPPDAPEVDKLAFSGPNSTLSDSSGAPPQAYPLMVAVAQKPGAGVAKPRGLTRIVVVGDSLAFENRIIDLWENRDFIGYAVNWLLDETQMLNGIGPKPVTEYRLLMTQKQQQDTRWLLLGALPGAVLMFGGLVWFVRRK